MRYPLQNLLPGVQLRPAGTVPSLSTTVWPGKSLLTSAFLSPLLRQPLQHLRTATTESLLHKVIKKGLF